MSDDQFTKLFTYIEERFDSVSKKLEQTADKNDVEKLINVIDGHASNLDTYASEMAAMQHKIDRLEKYIQVLAKKTGTDLTAVQV
jgi:predicted  nucleic acid-binding Zn-ribbon protein